MGAGAAKLSFTEMTAYPSSAFGEHWEPQLPATSRQTARGSECRLSARDPPLSDYRMRSVAGLALVFAQRLTPL
jgi:hypothetical protein